MAHTRHALVHYERDDGSVTHSRLDGSTYESVVASSLEEAEKMMQEKVKELDGHSFEFV
ncbi:hypothetical protein PHABIO_390 [Pseudomonas phage Phabio]|uniref:Uncharacterized protein n=1 Tax=Pseudomonas phage Phabio TaxID=2006668 RepID=A0A1Y0SU35_9CAUD|nr:hypothetical protein MZD05_gp390 [Pseudomonas phage Phabio]ARV77021.1 hypothetical protein PHABIO_390 [Pseudomonas phage Phabio]